MAATVLITGSTDALEQIADAVRAAGGEPVVASSPEQLSKALEEVGKGGLKHFLQTPQRVESDNGGTATSHVHEFLKQGLLSRYRTAEAVLPYLSDDAQVVLVTGNVQADASAPDDRSARLSLVHVLKHALRADTGGNVTVRVADQGTEPAVLAKAVLAGGALGNEGRGDAEVAVDPGLNYDDWRTEMLGGMEF